MSRLQDSSYLQNEQYINADKLKTRISLHTQFSTNKYGWFQWVFDHFSLDADARILELGCGPGDLWLQNIHRVPASWQITLSDFSPGMVNQARNNLKERSQDLAFHVIDAQSIPFREDTFHIVIANHCIYHVPDRKKAFSEIYRVLKKGGRFYATTIGVGHLKEITEIIMDFDPTLDDIFGSRERPFTLENGQIQLQKWFNRVAVDRYQDSLCITEVQPLVDYILSTVLTEKVSGRKETLTGYITAQMKANEGVIYVNKDSGLFTAVKI